MDATPNRPIAGQAAPEPRLDLPIAPTPVPTREPARARYHGELAAAYDALMDAGDACFRAAFLMAKIGGFVYAEHVNKRRTRV